jgi:tetratricopeptide (TPR) repeat protein
VFGGLEKRAESEEGMSAVRRGSARRVATDALSGRDDGRMLEAIETLEELRKRDPDDPALADRLGDLYMRVGLISTAVTHYRAAAGGYEQQKHVRKAAAVWKKVIRSRPELLDVHIWLAELHTRAGQVADAKHVYEALLTGVQKTTLLAMPNIVAIIRRHLAELDQRSATSRRTT